MRWRGNRQSDNVEDRRGAGPQVAAIGGVGTLILIVVVVLLGGDPRAVIQMQQEIQRQNPPAAAPSQDVPVDPEQEELKELVSTILADTEDVWTELFAQMGKTYDKPRLVLFTNQVNSACGLADSAVGPFYCPADSKVYIDLGFYDELARKYGAPGDFAQAYVLAHEVGHHVQNLLGLSDQVRRAQSGASKVDANDLSVRLELQADFLAGVWAHHAQQARNLLEHGDVEEALQAASAIGDDRLQRKTTGRVVPDSFTHGTSKQRMKWFTRGLETGDINQGDTFAAKDL